MTFGLLCYDFSPLGQRKKSCGPSSRTHGVFRGTVEALGQRQLLDIYVTECSGNYPAYKKQKQHSTAPVFQVVAVRTNSLSLSFPIRRHRSLAAGILLAWWVWTGPDQHQIEDDVSRFFHRQVLLNGNVYFTENDEDIFQYAASLPTGRRRNLKQCASRLHDQPQNSYFSKVCTPGEMIVKDEHQEFFQAHGIEPPHFADLAHHPRRGSAPGNVLPALDSHP